MISEEATVEVVRLLKLKTPISKIKRMTGVGRTKIYEIEKDTVAAVAAFAGLKGPEPVIQTRELVSHPDGKRVVERGTQVATSAVEARTPPSTSCVTTADDMRQVIIDAAETSMADFIEIDEKSGAPVMNFRKATRRQLASIKKLKFKQVTVDGEGVFVSAQGLELELYDRVAAAGKAHDMIKSESGVSAEDHQALLVEGIREMEDGLLASPPPSGAAMVEVVDATAVVDALPVEVEVVASSPDGDEERAVV